MIFVQKVLDMMQYLCYISNINIRIIDMRGTIMSISTKEYFLQIFELDKDIEKITEQLEFLRYKLSSPSSSSIGLGVQQSRNIHASQDLLVKIIILEEELSSAKERLMETEINIRKIIHPLPPMQRITMTWRYIVRITWKEIAKKMDKSEMQIMRYHKAALTTLDEIHKF